MSRIGKRCRGLDETSSKLYRDGNAQSVRQNQLQMASSIPKREGAKKRNVMFNEMFFVIPLSPRRLRRAANLSKGPQAVADEGEAKQKGRGEQLGEEVMHLQPLGGAGPHERRESRWCLRFR